MANRLCHITLASDYRGGERQAEILLRELSLRDWHQRLIVRHGNELVKRCADVVNLEIVEVASNPFAAAFSARGSALVHAHEARCVYSGALASLFFGIPYIFTRRVPNPQRRSILRRTSYRWASTAVAVSDAVAKGMHTLYPNVAVRVVPDAHAGLYGDPDVVKGIRARYPEKVIIGHVGALDHSHKGQLTIIDAARIAAKRHPDWQFLLCGDGRDEQQLRDAARDLGNIEFTGFVDNIGDYYSAFDVFVFPSLKEGLGSAMLDAMYFGLPVVASNVDGIPEFLEDGTNGRLIDPERPDQLIDGIREVVSQPEWAASVRAANIEKAMTLDAVAMADRYEAIYGDILV